MRRESHVRFSEGVGVRFPGATQLVIGFAREDDARRVMAVLPKRLGRYGLTLHPEKTRLVPYQRPPLDRQGPPGAGGPGSFDFLGFTHYWARSRSGKWVIKRKTAKSRFGRALKRVAEWCRLARHRPVSDQHRDLVRKLKGHYGYYGITGNHRALARFRREVEHAWKKWLARRSQRAIQTREHFDRLLERYRLPTPTVVHSIYPRAANP
jgi:hypothetical protein